MTNSCFLMEIIMKINSGDKMFNVGYSLDGRYEIREVIGTGGGGIVYKAYQKSVGRYVAIKLIKDNISKSIDIHGEADVLKKLKHTYIPAVYDFIIENNNVYTVMEFVEGKTLDEILKEKHKLPQRQVIKYARQLCEVTQYLHSQNPPVIHSDIKPANIMITPKDDICLIDYNISLVLTGEQSVIGVSAGYSAPEQYGVKKQAENCKTALDNADDETMYTKINTEYTQATKALFTKKADTETLYTQVDVKSSADTVSCIDNRSDIYSIGATLYHLASGIKPVASYESVVPLNAQKYGISESLAAIINKAMEKNPEKRFKTASQMNYSLVNLHKSDSKYKSLVIKQEISIIAVIALMTAALMTAFLGYRMTGSELEVKYDSYISDMENKSLEEMAAIYDEAVSVFPQRAEAYEKMITALYDERKYSEVCEFADKIEEIGELYVGSDKTLYFADKIYYLAGSSYFELGEYRLSAEAFNKATLINTTEAVYLRDYAVSLARCGETQKAEDVLEHAKSAGLTNDSIAYTQGEILYSSGRYSESIDSFQSCISDSKDADLKYRAYIICSSAYEEAYKKEDITADRRIKFLSDAVKAVEFEKTMPLYEMLSQAYIDAGEATNNSSYYKDAALTIEKMNSFGWRDYNSDNNLIILYQKTGSLSSAKSIAEEMLDHYGEDYNIYKRLAFVEVEIQNSADADKRNYSEFLNYYNKALQLCNDNSDMEMLLLEDIYEQLKKGNWL